MLQEHYPSCRIDQHRQFAHLRSPHGPFNFTHLPSALFFIPIFDVAVIPLSLSRIVTLHITPREARHIPENQTEKNRVASSCPNALFGRDVHHYPLFR